MIDADLAEVAERLRRITVRVRTPGQGDGCGVIWSSDGQIVTNAHVARTGWLEVELWDGRSVEARVRWRDPHRDIAVLAIPAGLTAATLGDPSQLRPGEIVLAFGHPFGLPNALALGVVHRTTSDGTRARWIMADIRLAPGNSGGPLANTAGEVVGINTLIAGGLAYAIPVSAVQRMLSEIGARAA